MKTLPILLLFALCSISALAQFPLKSNKTKIKVYFNENVPYSFEQEYIADSGDSAVCFTKTKAIGDFTFYFDHSGLCNSYVVTYGRKDWHDVEYMLDHNYCRLTATHWLSEEGKFDVDVKPPAKGANYFSVIYKSDPLADSRNYVLASN